MQVFHLKQNDTSPAMSFALLNADGTPVDLTGATVVFNMRRANGTAAITRGSVALGERTNGEARYEWKVEDTKKPGIFYGEFEVIFSNNQIETFPNDGYISIHIKQDLG